MITFVLPNSYTLSLLDKVSFLEAQVRHLTKEASHIPVHNEAFNYLVSIIYYLVLINYLTSLFPLTSGFLKLLWLVCQYTCLSTCPPQGY